MCLKDCLGNRFVPLDGEITEVFGVPEPPSDIGQVEQDHKLQRGMIRRSLKDRESARDSVFEEASALARRYGAVNLGSGTPDLPVPDCLRTAALAAVAGTMYLMYYGVVNFNDGFTPGVKAFTAAVLGGIGSLPGAVVGGLLIGLVETMWSAYFSIDYKDVAAFSILAITLIFLPQGILGRPDVEKV